MTDVYLDVELGGEGRGAVVVVGLLVERGVRLDLVQLVAGRDPFDLRAHVPHRARLFTFNGASFDLPRLLRVTGVDLRLRCEAVDLLHVGRAHGLRGGLKRLEVAIGHRAAARPVPDLRALWAAWRDRRDDAALRELLAYNAEDLRGTRALKEHLRRRGAIAARFG